MFGRRVFGSLPIPQTMYARLNINSAAQASRMLPTLIALTPSLGSSSMGDLMRAAQCSSGGSGLDVTPQDPVLLKALIEAMSPLQLGYLRLLELWGLHRTCVIKNMPQLVQ